MLLDPWLRAGDIWMVYSAAGIGKTFFALNVAYAIATGGKFLCWKAPRPRSVLYVDGEMADWEMQERLRGVHESALKSGNGLPGATRNFTGWAATYQKPGSLFPDLATEAGLSVLLEKAIGKDLVVIDNLSTTMQSIDQNSASEWISTMQTTLVELRKRGTAVLLVHHSNKGGDQSGTSAKDVILNGKIKLERPADHPKAGAAFLVQWEKARSLREEDKMPIQAELVEIDGLPAWDHKKFITSKLLELKRMAQSGDYATQKEMAEALGVDKSRVTQMKNEGVDAGLWTNPEWNRWMREAREQRESLADY